MLDYLICGWHLRSDKPLSLISAAQALSSRTDPDIHVTHAPIPPINQPILFSSPLVTIYANGQALLSINTRLSMLASGGQQIIIDAANEIPQGEIMTFLLGPALGLLCHQRQVLPLHGATIRIGNSAVTIVGQSGAGKSTTAAALISRGHQLLCDDITIVDSEQATVRPSYPAIKLWQEAADALSIETRTLDKTRESIKKFHYPIATNFALKPTALSAIIILYPKTHIASPTLAPLSKINALAQLGQQIYRRKLANLLGAEQACLNQLGQLITNIPVMALMRPDNFATLDNMLDLIESTVAQ